MEWFKVGSNFVNLAHATKIEFLGNTARITLLSVGAISGNNGTYTESHVVTVYGDEDVERLKAYLWRRGEK